MDTPNQLTLATDRELCDELLRRAMARDQICVLAMADETPASDEHPQGGWKGNTSVAVRRDMDARHICGLYNVVETLIAELLSESFVFATMNRMKAHPGEPAPKTFGAAREFQLEVAQRVARYTTDVEEFDGRIEDILEAFDRE